MSSFLRLCPILFLCLLSLNGKAGILDNTRKVSLIFVGPAKGLSESTFGHVALKFSPETNGGLLDMVIEFVADIPRNENPLSKYIRGAGVGKNKYQVKADLSSFYDFRKRKTIDENRSLIVYDLKLSNEEVTRVVDYIESFQEQELGEDYVFLTKNCSYFAASALESATGKKINNKSFPWKVDDKLRKLGLVTAEKKYPDASSERERLATKYLDESLGTLFPSGWKESFALMLGEPNISFRQSSYLKLLWLLKAPSVTEKDKKKVHSLIRYLISFENDAVQYTLRNLFKNPENKKLVLLPLIRMESKETRLPKTKFFKHDLVLKKNAPIIRISWSGKNHSAVEIPLPSLKFADDFSLQYEGNKVGRYIRTKSDRWILSQRLDYALDIDRVSGTVRTFLYVDLSDNVKDLKLALPSLKEKGILALNNAIDFKGELGSCYAMVLLQKAFLERAIFIPGTIPTERIDKFALMRELFIGKYVVLPGYKNIHEFTSSIPKEEFKKFIRNLQASLQKDRFAQMKENILEREILDDVTDLRLKSMLDEGLHIPLIIGMSHKGTLKAASSSAHAILVHDMKVIPEGYRLTAYDPNTGLNTLYVLNKEFRLEYPFYDRNYDYVGMIDRIDAQAMTLDHAVRSREIDTGKIKPLLRNAPALLIEGMEITKVLQ